MKKLLLSIAAMAAFAATANAQQPGCQDCNQGGGGYGYGGFLSSKKAGLFGGGMFSGLFTNHGSAFGKQKQQIPVVDPRGGNAGQLVFPQNPFIRSPRDFFMWEER